MPPTHSTATRVVCTSTRWILTLALESRTSAMRLSMRLTHSIITLLKTKLTQRKNGDLW